MNECGRVKMILDAWEAGRSVSREELSFLMEHSPSCPRCSRSAAPIIPFMERDMGGAAPRSAEGQPDRAADGPSDGFTDAVMEDIRSARPARRPAAARYFLAAAAVLVLSLGIGLLAFRAGAAGRSGEILVHFELAAPEARNVALVGSFTQWEPGRLEMKDVNGNGVWEISVRLKKGEVYTYNFLIDGTVWVPDPGAPAQIDDGFGGVSSVIQL